MAPVDEHGPHCAGCQILGLLAENAELRARLADYEKGREAF